MAQVIRNTQVAPWMHGASKDAPHFGAVQYRVAAPGVVLSRPMQGLKTLLLHNGSGSKLSQKAFYIGSSEKGARKAGIVGRFGEGLNLSLAAFWRAGIPVEITSDGVPWSLSEHDGQLWISSPGTADRFPIGAVQYASHAMGPREGVRELVANWLDECSSKGSIGDATPVSPGDPLEWSLGPAGKLVWCSGPVQSPTSGVVFRVEGLPDNAFDPSAFLRLRPPRSIVPGASGGLLLGEEHIGMVFVHGVRFDALTSPVRILPLGTVDPHATGSGLGYALNDPHVKIPRDRDAMADHVLFPPLAPVLIGASNVPAVQERVCSLLFAYPNGLESKVIRYTFTQGLFGPGGAMNALSMELARAALGLFRRHFGQAAFAVDRPMQHMDLEGMRKAGLEPVDMTQSPTLAQLLRIGGHPELAAAIAAARAEAEKAAVDVTVDPQVRQHVEKAASELGRAAGVVVRVRIVDGPPFVRRHVRAVGGAWDALIRWELLDPRSIHGKHQGCCPAPNREGRCSCAFVATVKEVLAGAKDAGIVNPAREQALLWSMLALGATGDALAPPPPSAEALQDAEDRLVVPGGPQPLGSPASEDRRQTRYPGDVVERGPPVKDPQHDQSALQCLMPPGRMLRDPEHPGPVGVYLEEGPEATAWAKKCVGVVAALKDVLLSICAACHLQGGGVHVYVGKASSNVYGFNQQGSIFISARKFATLGLKGVEDKRHGGKSLKDFIGLSLKGVEAADRVFAWIKHELAHNHAPFHDAVFLTEMEEVGGRLDPAWFGSPQREALIGG